MRTRIAILVGLVFFAALSWVLSFEAQRLENLTQRVGALEPREFDVLTLVTAGTGAGQEDPERLGPLLAIGAGERIELVDAGRAAAEALRRSGIPLTQIDTIYLTSLLPENVAGLGELYLTGWVAPRTTPLRLVGPPGTRALAESLERAHAAASGVADQIGQSPEGARIEAIEAEDGFREERDGLVVRAAALPGGPLPALAFRFEHGGRAMVVGGTGWGGDALVALAEGADILVHDAVHTPSVDDAITRSEAAEGQRLARESALHTPVREAGALAARAGVKKLVLVQLRPPPLHDRQYVSLVREEYAGHVQVAEDADEFTR